MCVCIQAYVGSGEFQFLLPCMRHMYKVTTANKQIVHNKLWKVLYILKLIKYFLCKNTAVLSTTFINKHLH